MFETIKTRLRPHIQKVFSAQASPHEIALGFAVGTFVELLPVFGVKTLLSLLLARMIKRINRPAMFGAVAMWNSFLILPIYGLSYQLGATLFGAPACNAPLTVPKPLYSGMDCFALVFLPGLLVVAVAITVFTYVALRLLLAGYQRRRQIA